MQALTVVLAAVLLICGSFCLSVADEEGSGKVQLHFHMMGDGIDEPMVGAGNSSFRNDEPMVGAGNDEPKEKAIINDNRRWPAQYQYGKGGKSGMGGWNSWTTTKDHGGWSTESREPGGSWGNKHQDPCSGVSCTGIHGKVKGGKQKWEPNSNRPWERRNHDDNLTNRGRRRGSDVGSCCNVIQTINLK